MPFAWDAPPRLIGHRGAPTEAPENTLASFAAAARAGADAIELDVRMTRDGHLVVAHDATCGRTVSGSGAIEAMSLDDVRARDAGAWFSPGFAGERVPLLSEVLRELPPKMALDVEIKADAENAPRVPAALHALLREHRALDRVLVTSFDPSLAHDYMAIAERPAGAITAFEPEEADMDDWRDLPFVALVRDVAAGPALDALVDAKKTVLVWTVNDAAEAQRLLARGAAGIITDRPAAVRSAAAAPPP